MFVTVGHVKHHQAIYCMRYAVYDTEATGYSQDDERTLEMNLFMKVCCARGIATVAIIA